MISPVIPAKAGMTDAFLYCARMLARRHHTPGETENMIRASLAALALSCSDRRRCAAAPQDADKNRDPYLWLEDIEGAKALDWVKRKMPKPTS